MSVRFRKLYTSMVYLNNIAIRKSTVIRVTLHNKRASKLLFFVNFSRFSVVNNIALFEYKIRQSYLIKFAIYLRFKKNNKKPKNVFQSFFQRAIVHFTRLSRTIAKFDKALRKDIHEVKLRLNNKNSNYIVHTNPQCIL